MDTTIEKIKNITIKCLTADYANFSGRASRSEFWYFVLFIFIVNIGLTVVLHTIGLKQLANLLTGIFRLAVFVPSIAVGARRLHDIDKSGWWQLVGLIPLLGSIYLIVLACQRGTTGTNRFGNDPLQN